MIDITLKLDKENKVWDRFKLNESTLLSAGHMGTHLDVYNHSQVPLEYFKSKCKIIDCEKYDFDKEIGIEVLEGKVIDKGDFIIFNTGIQKKYLYGSYFYIHNHHNLSYELIEYLLNKKVAFIGIDAAGVRRGKEHKGADILAEENNTFIIENLDLEDLKNKNNEFIAYTMWIDNPFATGLSTRVILEEV
ncbi:cyclase family protein [uncultured Clostridium sp.]|jgi:kynurenine formamidase|uniref:cyclase family protein n=1 Tax=uncultured Clostridium sp. TaxID=59620 RepID=UPI00260BB47B|nr:cyclase family protein [uncultured Clostridium sp.]